MSALSDVICKGSVTSTFRACVVWCFCYHFLHFPFPMGCLQPTPQTISHSELKCLSVRRLDELNSSTRVDSRRLAFVIVIAQLL